jgi:hypothetical protein
MRHVAAVIARSALARGGTFIGVRVGARGMKETAGRCCCPWLARGVPGPHVALDSR